MIKYFYKISNKIIMFQEVLQFKDFIILYYIRKNTIKINRKVPSLFISHISKINLDFFLLLWVFMIWTNLIAIGCFLMHYSLPLLCVKNSRKKLQIHGTKSIWLMMILGLFLVVFICFQHRKEKFVMLWNFSFLLK